MNLGPAALILLLAFSTMLPARAQAPANGGSADEEISDSDEFDDFEEFDRKGPGELKPVFDPLRGYNRFMYKVNDKFYFWFAKPVARGYRFVVPQPGRVAVNKAFYNLRFPVRFVNCLLQLKFKKAGVELGRFVVNSSVGIGGLSDPAGRWLKWRKPGAEDFGQTFGYYGVGDGFPIVLPLLGPTNLRDGVGMVPVFLYNPINYAADFKTTFSLSTGEQLNYLSLHIGEYESIKGDALDPYTFMRDAYKQNRDKKIRE